MLTEKNLTRRSRIGFAWTNQPTQLDGRLEVVAPDKATTTGFICQIIAEYRDVAHKNSGNHWAASFFVGEQKIANPHEDICLLADGHFASLDITLEDA